MRSGRFSLLWVLAALADCSGRSVPASTSADAAVRPIGKPEVADLAAVQPTIAIPQPRHPVVPDPPAPPHPWTAAPAGSTTRVFRELLVGQLPAHATRNTWWLVQAGPQVYLRIEEQHTNGSIPHLDRTSLDPDLWSAPVRSEYVGSPTRSTPPFTLKLQRGFGSHEPAELSLACATKTVAVHPAFATLVAGWKNDDDTMEPAAWAPPRTERVTALGCMTIGSPWPFSFGEGLSFAPGKTTPKQDSAGVEWAFVNSDMVIQEGGYRYIPTFSLGTP